ncbi:MAG: hypothetical protein MUD01_15465 [Chloroflexaceae bacterium]|nr:hypothetical protein [Chloroflexaceae bacterium]
MVHRLEIRHYEFAYEIPARQFSGVSQQADFLIDGEPLGQRLGLWAGRPWFGRTRFEGSNEQIDYFVQELLGLQPPQNQFGTNRLVLFGCHCGSDYCGIVSCRVVRDGSSISWQDIRYEDDNDSHPYIALLTFDRAQYTAAVSAFVAQLRHVTKPLL